MTHHVELVLPGAAYLVRMLDGRVDTQGTLADLRARGVLEQIAHADSADAAPGPEPAQAAEEFTPVEAVLLDDGGDGEAPGAVVAEAKDVAKGAEARKPRKLIKDEKREEGGVKWEIYKTYLKAS